MNAFSPKEISGTARVSDCTKAISANGTKAIDGTHPQLSGITPPTGGKLWLVEAANTLKDRVRDVFDIPVLEKYAADSKTGKANLYQHDKENIVGRVLTGWTEKLPDRTRLMQILWVSDKAVMPKQEKITLNEAIENGFLVDVSVGFNGCLKAVYKDEMQSEIDHWLWYLDAESTELLETSWVSAGCQRMAGAIKSVGATNPERENQVTMNHFQDKFLVGGELHAVKTVEAGGSVKVEGLDELVKKANEAITAKAAAETAKTTAETAQKAVEAEIKEVRDSLISEIELTEKALTLANPSKKEDLEKLKAADLMKKAADLRKQYDGGPEHREKSAFTTTEAY